MMQGLPLSLEGKRNLAPDGALHRRQQVFGGRTTVFAWRVRSRTMLDPCAPAEWMIGLYSLLNSPLKVFQGCNRLSIQVKHRLAKFELCRLGIEYLSHHLKRHPNIV